MPKPSNKTTPPASTGTKSAPAKNQAKKVQQSRKVVNARQTPWGLIITTIVLVALAIGVIGYAVSKSSSKKSVGAVDPSKIAGLITKTITDRNHVQGTVNYPDTPPIGGNHNAYWADCNGAVYPEPIASENAVHSLEHGSVWITYKQGLANDQVSTLNALVAGKPYMLMSPYPDLKSNISLQSWGHQLFVDNASDPRIQEFIATFRVNPTYTPELNSSCDNPDFKKNPSTLGHPWSPTPNAPHM